MVWEYLVLAVILVWAVFYLWRTFFQKKGCVCDSCPSAKKDSCMGQIMEARDMMDRANDHEEKKEEKA